MNILQTHDLTVGYTRPHRAVAEGLNLTLAAGELVCLIGPNGVGKSTLLRTIAGLQAPLAGQITLLGDDLAHLSAHDLAQRLSMVLTERVDVGLLPAYHLVALGRHPYTDWSGRLTAHDEVVVRQAIEAVGAVALAHRPVNELSDGERQKIMIARALAQEPDLMLLDEPTAYLDLPRRVETMSLLRRLAHETGRGILLSTHDLDLALRGADRIWLLPHDGPMQTGAPEDLVLSGAFEAAFQGEGVLFDRQTGSFTIAENHRGRIKLEGEGLPAVWTQRALERAGFEISSNGAQPLARVLIDGETWRVQRDGAEWQCHSLHEVVDVLSVAGEGENHG
jgi:iron complex transport system ATP-binding protein